MYDSFSYNPFAGTDFCSPDFGMNPFGCDPFLPMPDLTSPFGFDPFFNTMPSTFSYAPAAGLTGPFIDPFLSMPDFTFAPSMPSDFGTFTPMPFAPNMYGYDTDMFGFPFFGDMMDVDIMSGIPSSQFDHSWADVQLEHDRAILDESSQLESERDLAVDRYHDAIDSGDYEEALRWETIANDRQQDIYDLFDTPQFGLPARAPGL